MSAPVLAFESNIDSIMPPRLRGWCWFPERPDMTAVVCIRVGEEIVATIPADQFRQDLAESGKRGGACAFETTLELEANRGGVLRVGLSDGRLLPGGECVLAPSRDGTPSGWPLPLLGVDGYLESLGSHIRGWVAPPGGLAPAQLAVCEGDKVLLTIEAKEWWGELEDAHQGDGRGGFHVPLPSALRDGKPHEIDIRLGSRSLLAEPLRVTLDPGPQEPAPARPLRSRLRSVAGRVRRRVRREIGQRVRSVPLSPVQFSFIVNFYNMRREAERTLTSLTRAYQRDAHNIRYEVICVDNGSDPPLDAAWIRSFGPEFRLFRPSKTLPSPCFAINEAARQAQGRHLAIMIDGAHVVSPGVFREARAAIEEHRDTVVALRHWFVGGDQRFLNSVGYTREQEDVLFARARWPEDGYNLFAISAPMSESPNQWFDPIAESNCLFLPATLWREMGGYDEGFDEPGGGFCNLDLLRRAAHRGRPMVVLLGEATFHQYHEGTTTNVSDAEKDARVRAYANKYRHLRGEDFSNVMTTQFRLRGQMHDYTAFCTRQRPAFNAPFGITTQVRSGDLERWIDVGSREYLNGSYAEGGLHKLTKWRGQPVDLAPSDLMALQDILHAQRPERILITAAETALVSFLDDAARLLELNATRIVCVVDEVPAEPHPRVDYVVGPPYEASTLAAVTKLLGLAESVLVLMSPRADDFFPLEGLRAYARFVSFGSYLIVLRTVLGQPWLGYSKFWLKRVIYLFLQQSDFVCDETRTQHLISMCAGGYLARVKPPLSRAGDDALDHLAG